MTLVLYDILSSQYLLNIEILKFMSLPPPPFYGTSFMIIVSRSQLLSQYSMIDYNPPHFPVPFKTIFYIENILPETRAKKKIKFMLGKA